MAFAKGKSTELACIEGTIDVFKEMICEFPLIIKDKSNSFDEKIRKSAKEMSGGYDDIELSCYLQLSEFNLYAEWEFHFLRSFVATIYSFYERMLKRFFDKNNMQFLIKKGSCSKTKKYFQSIEEYINRYNLALTPKTRELFCEIEKTHRELRNKLVHNDTEVILIDSMASLIDEKFLIEFLDSVKSILLDIIEKLEIIYKQNNVSVYLQ